MFCFVSLSLSVIQQIQTLTFDCIYRQRSVFDWSRTLAMKHIVTMVVHCRPAFMNERQLRKSNVIEQKWWIAVAFPRVCPLLTLAAVRYLNRRDYRSTVGPQWPFNSHVSVVPYEGGCTCGPCGFYLAKLKIFYIM